MIEIHAKGKYILVQENLYNYIKKKMTKFDDVKDFPRLYMYTKHCSSICPANLCGLIHNDLLSYIKVIFKMLSHIVTIVCLLT